jgi:predicted dehydrogenase
MADRLRIGYVGAGFMAQKVHLPNLLALPECEVVALAEIRPKLGEKVRQRFGIPKLYRDHQELAADPRIEAVAVSGHFSGQGAIAADVLRAGKDVFMEKPLAVSVEQAEEIVAAERAGGRRLMVAYMKRYDAGNLLVKKLLDGLRQSGELGAVRFVRNHGYGGDWTAGLDTPLDKTDEPYPETPTRYPSWMPERFCSAFAGYLQQYTHNINLVRWFLGAGPGAVKVKAADLDANGLNGVALLEVAGVRTVIESGGVPYHGWEEHTQIYFQKGWLKTEAPPLLLRSVPATVELYRGDQPDKTLSQMFPAQGRTWSYKEELRHFIQCVRTGGPFRSPASDALEDIRALEEIYRKWIAAMA